jgi:5,10-methylenetetrahydromethanopterin reductase
MDFGIQLATSAHSWKVVQRAEELGFTHSWFYDTQLLNADMFVAMGATAMKTSRIRIGTGVLIPSNRLSAVTASALGTLNALAPGRIDFAVGTGFTGRRTMGQKAITLARMERHIREVQGLLAGDTIEWTSEGSTHKIRFLNPDLKLINIEDTIPLHVSAFGPRSRKLTAKLGAGWMTSARDAQSAGAAMKDMQDVWTGEGHDPGQLYATAVGGGCVMHDGEAPDSPRVKAMAGPAAAIALHAYAESEELGSLFPVPPPLQDHCNKYREEVWRKYHPEDARYLENHRGHLMFLRPEEESFVTGGLIKGMTLTGTASELVEQLQGLKAAGYKQFTIHARNGHETEMMEDWAKVMEKV